MLRLSRRHVGGWCVGQVAEFLLSKGAPLDENDNVGGWTPLFSAVYFGWPEVRRVT